MHSLPMRILRELDRSRATSTLFGSPPSSPRTAPEQLVGETMQASDVYALGVVFYKLLTRSRTLSSSGLAQIGAVHGDHARGVPELIARLTAHDPRLRPTAREAVALLRAAAVAIAKSALARWSAQQHDRSRTPSIASATHSPGWLKVVGFMAAGVATATAMNRATKTWDDSAGGYRGSNGRFRGGGFFE
jgi:serine/threonine protein kinase